MGVQFQVDVNVTTHGAEKVNELEQKLNSLQSKGANIKINVEGLDKINTSNINKQMQTVGKQASQNFNKSFVSNIGSKRTKLNNVVDFAKLQQQADKEVKNLSNVIQNGLGIDEKEADKIAKRYANVSKKSVSAAQREQRKLQAQQARQTQQDAKNNLAQQLSNVERLNKNKADIITARASGKSATVEALREERKQIKAEQKQLQKDAQQYNRVSGYSQQERAKAIESKQLATKSLVDKAWASVSDKESSAIEQRFNSELAKARKSMQTSLNKYGHADVDSVKEAQKLLTSMASMKVSDYDKPLEKISQVAQKTQELGRTLQDTHKTNLRAIQQQERQTQQTKDAYWKNYFQTQNTKSPIQQEMSAYYRQLEQESNQIAKIQQRANSGDFEARNAKVDKFLSKYKGQDSEVLNRARTTASELKALQSELQSGVYASGDKKGMQIIASDQAAMLDKINEKAQQLKNVFTEIRNIESGTLGYGVAERSANTVATYMENNTKALKKYGNALAELQIQYRSATTEMEKSSLDSRFANLKAQISAEGLTGNSVWTELSRGFRQIGQFAMTYGMIQSTVMQIPRKIISAVTDVDSAMTDLYKVTDETDKRYSTFLENAGQTSKDLGRNMSSYITQTANWSKLGYSLDESEQLSKLSSVYANVGEVSDETAVSDMVTAMKAFNIEASDAQKIIDSYNKLGNEFATTSADIGEGISNSASSLATAGNDFDKSVSMITGMSEITQSASEAGNALKIVSMRLRGYDEETQSYSNDVEKLSGDIADLTKTADTPGGISLFTDDTKQTYKDTYTIMEDISKIYDELSDKDQAALLEKIAGKNRGNQIAALIQAFQSGQVQKAYEASKNSEGSAQQEQDRWMDSIEAKQQQFASQFQKFSNDFVSSDLVKGAIDTGSGALGFLDSAIQKFGALKTLVGGVALVKGIKSIV